MSTLVLEVPNEIEAIHKEMMTVDILDGGSYDAVVLVDDVREIPGNSAIISEIGAKKSIDSSAVSAHTHPYSMSDYMTISYDKYILPGTKFNLQFEQSKEYANWMNNIQSTCSMAIYPEKIDDVMYVVKHPRIFPSPVRAIGSMHSPTKCIVNDGGTSICMAGFNKIVSLELDRKLVTVQAGVKLSELHKYLAKVDLEIAFSPEIGDATVGGMVCHTNKDSAYDGNGTLQSIVRRLTYVNQDADLVTLSVVERDNQLNRMKDLQMFMCSAGLFGVVVEVTLEVRRRVKILSSFSGVSITSRNFMPTVLRKLRNHTNVFMFCSPRNNICFFECRDADAKSLFSTPINAISLKILQTVKYETFLHAKLPLIAQVTKVLQIKTSSYRSAYVNDYPGYIPAHKDRLTFFLLEFDFLNFEAVYTDMLRFHAKYRKEHNFEPEGYAIYFVSRTGLRPTGNFSGPPGGSFCMDPVYHKPNDPSWLAFQQALIQWAVTHNAKLSLNQSGDPPPNSGAEITLPKEMKSPRFSNTWLEKYVIWV